MLPLAAGQLLRQVDLLLLAWRPDFVSARARAALHADDLKGVELDFTEDKLDILQNVRPSQLVTLVRALTLESL